MPTIIDLIFNPDIDFDTVTIDPSKYRINVQFKPGYYKWWAKEEEVKELLKEHFNKLIDKLEPGSGELKGYYSIYFGISSSIKERLNKHINQEHSDKNVDNGFSTFRKSISSLLTGSLRGDICQEKTDLFIDKLKVTYCIVGSSWNEKTKKGLDDMEKEAFEDYFLPLNIKNNKYPDPDARKFIKYLSKIRTDARAKRLP